MHGTSLLSRYKQRVPYQVDMTFLLVCCRSLILIFNVFHPEVFDTYTINNNVQSNTTMIWYVIY